MKPSDGFSRMGVSPFFFGLLVVYIGILLSATQVRAQATSTGTVIGMVSDQQNAPAPGADVTLLDIATNSSRMTITNEAGRYIFVDVPPGTCDISIRLPGFSTAKVTAQKVTVGEVLTINVTLTMGEISETIEVKAGAGAGLQMTTATLGSTIAGNSLEFLTNLGRDANALFLLQAVVSPSGNVAGVAFDQNAYQLDGGNNTSDLLLADDERVARRGDPVHLHLEPVIRHTRLPSVHRRLCRPRRVEPARHVRAADE